MVKVEEIWQDIKGYEGIYQISTLLRVRSLDRKVWNRFQMIPIKGKVLKHNFRGGYPVLRLCNKSGKMFSMHRLVAIHFIPNPLNLPEVNHKDGNKANYAIDNLEWCDRLHNMRHASRTGLLPFTGEGNKSAKLTTADVIAIKNLKGIMSERKIAEMYGVAHCSIGAIHRGKKWKHLIDDHSKEAYEKGWALSRLETVLQEPHQI